MRQAPAEPQNRQSAKVNRQAINGMMAAAKNCTLSEQVLTHLIFYAGRYRWLYQHFLDPVFAEHVQQRWRPSNLWLINERGALTMLWTPRSRSRAKWRLGYQPGMLIAVEQRGAG